MQNEVARRAGTLHTNLLGLYMVLMAIILAFIVIALFPERITDQGGNVSWGTTLRFLDLKNPIKPELRLLLIIMAMGALGSYVHMGSSFISYVGNRSFVTSWTWWYILRPFVGMALAVIFYFVIRGGLFTTGASANDFSPYGFSAVAGLVGMFSKQATDKLEEIFNNLFQVSNKTGDNQRVDKLGRNRPVKENMIPLSQITAFTLSTTEDQISLSDILSLCTQKITRIPILDNSGRLLYLIHCSLLREFITSWSGGTQATLADLADDPDNRVLIYDSTAFVSESATVGEAKAAMDSIPRCQDVMITSSGRRDEPVIGWLTNIDIGRIASI